MSVRGILALSSMGMILFGQVIDSASAFAWVSNVGGLGIAAILALKTLPNAHREFRRALDRNTDAMIGLTVHLAHTNAGSPLAPMSSPQLWSKNGGRSVP